MSGWVQRYLQSKTQLTSSQQQPQPQSQSQFTPSSPFASDRTTYISTNTAEQKSFFAEAPVGSQHTARLQKLALQQQSEYRPPKPNATHMLERKVQRSITAQGEPPGSNNGITSPASPVQTGRRRSDKVPRSLESATQSATSPNQHIQPAPYGQPRPQPMHVDRYERDGMIAYHKKTAGGELLISAPVGSQEANGMDDAAARLLAAQAAYPAGYVRRKKQSLGRQESLFAN